MGFGFLIARFGFWIREYALLDTGKPIARTAVSPWLGFGMVVVGVFACVMAAVRHRDYIRALKEGISNPPLDVRTSLMVCGILALVGLAMAIQIIVF
jgi:putative membrane protein